MGTNRSKAMRSVQLNLRVPSRILKELERIAEEEDLERSAVARKLLTEGIRRWKVEHAVELYRRGRVTKERAAELAEVCLYEIMEEIREQGIPPRYTLDDLKEDLQVLRARGG